MTFSQTVTNDVSSLCLLYTIEEQLTPGWMHGVVGIYTLNFIVFSVLNPHTLLFHSFTVQNLVQWKAATVSDMTHRYSIGQSISCSEMMKLETVSFLLCPWNVVLCCSIQIWILWLLVEKIFLVVFFAMFWIRIPVFIVSFLHLDHRLSPQGSDLPKPFQKSILAHSAHSARTWQKELRSHWSNNL